MPQSQPDYLLLGEILRPHGVRGELRMRVLTDYPDAIAERGQVLLGTGAEDNSPRQYSVDHLRMHKGYALLKLQGINNRSDADPMRGLFVMIRTEDAVPLDDDEIYLFQLIGMQVSTIDGTDLGELVDVLETGANDVYIVQGRRFGEVLIPATDETIVETNTETNQITVKLPEGLLSS